MEKQKKLSKILIFIVTILVALLICNDSLAFDSSKYQAKVEYSQEYLDWLELDDETKANSIMPRMYNVYSDDNTMYNPLKSAKLMASTISNKFNLKDVIPKNMVIKNQGVLGACWAFSGLASLETNLALADYHNNSTSKVYDFSERHLEYATTKKFLNGAINENGFNRELGIGGSSIFTQAYLTNGMGAIDEKDMPYVDSNELIDISEIQNKKVTSQVYDIKNFPTQTSSNLEKLKTQMKEHITNYGGIDASTHEDTKCLNNETGALYCNDSTTHVPNHAILIVGWDDNYDKNNFNEDSKPTKNGAWIAKDSHGTDEENTYTVEKFKELLYEANKTYFNGQGITSASQIPDEFIQSYAKQKGWTITDGKIFAKHNDNGYLYISYEDINIYNGLVGIEKATNSVDYDNIYQYDVLGETSSIELSTSNIYLANIFDKKTNGEEYLTQVSISTPETVTCKVYVNPKGNSKAKLDLQLIQLKQGESKTIDAGYHTLEFANPVKITGDEYAVVIELQGKRSNKISFSMEFDFPDYYKKSTGKDIPSTAVLNAYGGVKIETGKCFMTVGQSFEQNEWEDLSKLYTSTNGNAPDGDSTIKAFSVSKVDENIIKEIKITTPPTKTEYQEGEKFDKTGMVVKAVYQDETEKEISDYTIQDGDSLKANQSTVTINYQGCQVKQNIKVKAKTTVNPVEEEPENSNFDNSNLKVDSVKYYVFSDPNTQGYVLMDVEVNGIVKNKLNDEYKYYYYLSTKQNETNINNWVEIKNGQITDDGKIKFQINTKDIKNYDEIANSDTIYLYVKEDVKKGSKEATVIANPMKLETDVESEIYLDNQKYENNNNNSGNDQNEQISGEKKEEGPNQLPSTGNSIKIGILSTIILAIIGMILYKKYNNYKDIK